MGLTAVLNDTPEKRAFRHRLLALLGDPAFEPSPNAWDNNGLAMIIVVAQGIFDDVQLAEICSTEQARVTVDDIQGWGAGFETEIPDLTRQAEIAKLLLIELKRMEAAVVHD